MCQCVARHDGILFAGHDPGLMPCRGTGNRTAIRRMPSRLRIPSNNNVSERSLTPTMLINDQAVRVVSLIIWPYKLVSVAARESILLRRDFSFEEPGVALSSSRDSCLSVSHGVCPPFIE
jgi:hypothetical protein